MNFDERFVDLFKQGEKDQAKELAKAVLRNEPISSVEVTNTEVHVETPSFHGTHEVTIDNFGEVDIQRKGQYRYKSDAIDLSFSTLTMSDTAYDKARAHLTKKNEAAEADVEHEADNEDETDGAETAAKSAADEADEVPTKVAADEEHSTGDSAVDYLKQFF